MSSETVDGGRRTRGWKLVVALSAAAVLGGCADTPRPAGVGVLSGQVVVSGPLRKATISVDQLDYSVKSSVAVRAHVADTTTDDEGRFSVDTGTYSGLLLVTARGGSFTDLATGATIQLDPTAGLESIEPLDLLEQRDDALVSPVGQLIAARTRWKMTQLHDVVMAERDAEDHLGRHFAGVPWLRVKLAPLDAPATSPTESVRAALVHAALSFLAADIAQAAGASPQEVNVLTLTQELAADIGQGPFDGNDGNSPTPGEGLQVGACPPIAGCSAPPAQSCTLGACRPLCDLYAGTPRALLAGEVTKVIQSSAINHTGLVTGDILAIARSMADDVDDDLFGQACLENLDRLPPRLDWAMPTPPEGAYVRASFGIKAVATDDTDPRPQVMIDGFPNEPADSAALAMIDSSQVSDGMLVVTAEARDIAGNAAAIRRTVQVDNTPPTLTLDPTGYLVDGNTWWTATASPILTGTIGDASPVTITTSTIAGTNQATVTGASWSGGVSGALDVAGADVAVTATDAAGNRTQITQHIRADITPPRLTFDADNVRDEANETPTFDVVSEAPIHLHTGTKVDLTTEGGCPKVTKFTYLLGASPPPYGSEVSDQGMPDPNPLQYLLVASDEGVGIAPGSTQYRVGFRTAGGTTWLLDWTPAGTPVNVGAGVDRYTIGIFSDQVPQLATTEGIYDVEFRATDRLARTTTVARCFELHLRAPPLHFQTPGVPPDPIPKDHAYRLESLGLTLTETNTLFLGVAARLLDDNATGASLLDEDVTNGTASTVYLDVGATGPDKIDTDREFQLGNVASAPRTVAINCTKDPDNPPPALCHAAIGPTYTSAGSPQSNTNPKLFVKVFELDAGLAPATEVPCLACGIHDHWTFAIPPRSGGTGALAPARRFKVMTMIGQLSQLWPSDGMFPVTPPFRDTALNGIPFTRLTSPAFDVCTSHSLRQLPDGTVLDTCTRVVTFTSFRALTRVHLHIDSPTVSTYATAPTPMATPVFVTRRDANGDFSWDHSDNVKCPLLNICK